MTPHKLVLAALLFALAGCGKAEPTKLVEPKHGDKNDTAGTPTPLGTNTPIGVTPMPPTPLGPSLLEPNDPVQQLAERFIADLRIASDSPDPGPLPAELLKRISPAFLKVIGKPLLTPADKLAGYNPETASAWLRRLGTRLVGIAPPMGFGSPSMAVLVGSYGNGSGRILIRMVFAEGWKVDGISLGTIPAPTPKATSTEGAYQDFAVLSFLDALTGNATPKDDRVALLGGVFSTKLKNAWAEPFNQDKDRGYDYSATKIGLKLDELGAGVTGFTRSPIDGESFKVELAKGEAKAAYTLKLVKGATPGEWFVEEFTKQ